MTGLVIALIALVLAAPAAAADWPMFGYTSSRSNTGPASTGITAANVGHLHRRVIHLDGTVDSSPIYLHGVTVRGKAHDVAIVTTDYGKTEAIDARSGAVLWRYTPPTYGSYAGSAQIMTMTPLADPDRTAVYAGEPDGRIVKLTLAAGKRVWSTSITRDPTHEKLAGSLNFSNGLVLAATDGYIGDAPPYQGHIVSMKASNGRIVGVFNSLCSNRHAIQQPSTCPGSDSAVWGRSAPLVDPRNGNVLGATGNGPYDGRTNWGDSVIVLSPDAKRLVGHWTPANQADLNSRDLDLGSTAPAFLAGGYLVQGGKDGLLRLLSPRLQLLQTVSTPGGTDLFSAPCVWNGNRIFVADGAGTAAWVFRGGKLHAAWSNGNDGTSPVLAGGLLYVQGNGHLRVYRPASGRQLADLPLGTTHWESPIVADGRVIAVEGNSNDHAQSGVLDLYTP